MVDFNKRVSFRSVFSILILVLFHSVAVAQNQRKADSLLTLLENASIPTEARINLYLHAAHNHVDPSMSLFLANEALNESLKIRDKELEAKAYEEIGVFQRVLGNNLEATRASLKALAIFESMGRSDLKVAVLTQVGSNAVTDEDYPSAIQYFRQAIEIYQQRPEDVLYLAMTKLNLGEAFRLSDELDSALIYFNTVLSINDSLGHPAIEAYAIGNLGMTYNALEKLKDARIALNESLDLVGPMGDPYTQSVYLADLALVSQKEQKWSAAESRFLEALQIAKDNALKEQIRDISEMLVTYYKLRDDFENALVYQELFQVYQDSLVNKENVQELERVKANFEISQRDVEIGLLNERDERRKQQSYAAIGVMSIFIGLSVMLYRSNRAKKKANVTLTQQKEVIRKREEEKALLLKELNHRVKNNLQMISSLLNLQGNELKGHPAQAAITAGKYRVDALALIHQKLYRKDIHTTIALKDYIEELVLNLCYSFNNRVKPQLHIEPISVSIDLAIPLALIVNELVTNALKYAYEDSSNPELSVHLNTENTQLTLQVKDNGTGIPDENPENLSSFGIKLVYSLTRQLKAKMNYTKKGGSQWTLITTLK